MISLSGTSFLEKLEIGPKYLEALKNHKVIVTFVGLDKSQAISFKHPTVDLSNFKTTLPGNVVKLVAEGNLGSGSIGVLSKVVSIQIQKVLAEIEKESKSALYEDLIDAPELEKKAKIAVNEMFDELLAKKAEKKSIEEKLPKNFEASAKKGKPLTVGKLRNAKEMYQQVRGTDAASVYLVIALSKEINVAARMKNGNISFRVEGPGMAALIPKLQKAGLKASSDTHYSIHMEVSDELRARTLGAFLAALDHEFDSPMPKLSKLINEGM